MDRYIEQLIEDLFILKKKENNSMPSLSFEEEMEEIERFVTDEPEFTLGNYIKLEKTIFPPKEKLSELQCNKIVDALKEVYSSYLITLNIPDEIPIAIKYEFYVEFLDKKIFMSDYTMVSAEFCGDDFSICPFGVKNCKCFKNWKKEVKRILKMPEEDRSELQLLDVGWYYLLEDHKLALSEFYANNTPNEEEISKILEIIEKATLDFIRGEGVIWYSPEENQMPEKPVYKQIFEWMGFGKINFPDPEILTEIEIKVVGYELLKFMGKDDVLLALLNISSVKRYVRLVALFNSEMAMGKKMHFYCRPHEIYPHEIPNLLTNLGIDFFENKTNYEDGELPF